MVLNFSSSQEGHRQATSQQEYSPLNTAFIEPSSGRVIPSPNERRFREIADRANHTPISATTVYHPLSPISPVARQPQLSPTEMRLREISATADTCIANTSYQFPPTPPHLTNDTHNIAFMEMASPQGIDRQRWDNLVNRAGEYALRDTSCPCDQSTEGSSPRTQHPSSSTPTGERYRWDNLVNEAAGHSLGDESFAYFSSPEATPARNQHQSRPTPPGVERNRWDNLTHEATGYSLRDTSCPCPSSPETTPPRSHQPSRPSPSGLETNRWNALVDEASGQQSFMNDTVDLECDCDE